MLLGRRPFVCPVGRSSLEGRGQADLVGMRPEQAVLQEVLMPDYISHFGNPGPTHEQDSSPTCLVADWASRFERPLLPAPSVGLSSGSGHHCAASQGRVGSQVSFPDFELKAEKLEPK